MKSRCDRNRRHSFRGQSLRTQSVVGWIMAPEYICPRPNLQHLWMLSYMESLWMCDSDKNLDMRLSWIIHMGLMKSEILLRGIQKPSETEKLIWWWKQRLERWRSLKREQFPWNKEYKRLKLKRARKQIGPPGPAEATGPSETSTSSLNLLTCFAS